MMVSPMSVNSCVPKPRVVPADTPRRKPEGHSRRLRIERNGILVGGQAGAFEALAGDITGQFERP